MEKYKIISIEIDGQIYDLRRQKLKETEHPNPKKIEVVKPVGMKRCSKCKLEKSIKENFNNDRTKKDGLQTWCKDCKNEYTRRHHKKLKVRERQKAYMREYMRKKREAQSVHNDAVKTIIVSSEQVVKPDIPIINGSDPDALPVTPIPESVDRRHVDSVVDDPVKRKNLWHLLLG